MYPPKPRSSVQRRHTISGGSPLYKRPSHTIEQVIFNMWYDYINPSLICPISGIAGHFSGIKVAYVLAHGLNCLRAKFLSNCFSSFVVKAWQINRQSYLNE